MAISLKHTFQSAKADGADTTLVQPSNWNAEHTITAAAGKVLGRDTSGAGAVQELPIAVDTSGNVGIGTSSPGAKLDVNDGFIISTRYGNSSALQQRTAAGTVSAPTSVGTNTLIGAWQASGYDGSAYRTAAQIFAYTEGAVSGTSSPGRLEFYTTASGSVTPTERMRITSAGDVGIGTTVPAARLDVRCAAGGTSIYATDTTNSTLSIKHQTGSLLTYETAGVAIQRWVLDGSERMRIDSAGQVGIGTANPNAKLDVVVGADQRLLFTERGTGGAVIDAVNAANSAYKLMVLNASQLDVQISASTKFSLAATSGTITSQPTYDNTAAGSTVVVTSTGLIRRTSSSIKYKKDVESLDPALATNAIEGLRPVWYRTKNPEGDDKATWSHIGLIAEEVHEVEPRLVRYRTAEVIDEQKPVLDEAGEPVLDEEGNPTFTTERVERELAVPEPEDVDYARLSVLLLAKVKELETRLAALEAA